MKMYTGCTLKTNAFGVHLIKDSKFFIKSQQHRCSKGIVDVSHNSVTASVHIFMFCLIAILNCKIYLFAFPISNLF